MTTNARCESGWTGDRCTLPLFHDGPHSNEAPPRVPYAKGTDVTFGSEDAEGTIVAVAVDATTREPNGWYVVEFSDKGRPTTDSMHHSEIDPIELGIATARCSNCGDVVLAGTVDDDGRCEDCPDASDLDRGTGPDAYPPILRDAAGRPYDVG